MYLPENEADRTEALAGIAHTCTHQDGQRRGFYSRLTNNYLTGTDGLDAARHNTLQEVIKESASDIYADGMTRFGVDLEQRHGDEFLDEEEAVAEDAQQWWHNSKSGLAMSKAVEWAHVWPAAVLKVFVDKGGVVVRLVPSTADISVLRPEEPEWADQEAVCHSYAMDLSSFDRRIRGTPNYREMMRIAMGQAAPPEAGRDAMPAAFRSIVLASWSPTMVGAPANGALSPNGLELAMAEPQSREPVVRLRETWVWDDKLNDYRVALMFADHDNLLINEFPNPLVPGQHPFFPLILDPLPFSAWSVPIMVGLLGLQMMHDDFLNWIAYTLSMQFNPPLYGTGISGILEEKIEALRTPGGTFTNPLPQGDVKNFAPQMPVDGFPMIEMLKQMIWRRAGRPPGMTGESPSRSGDQVMGKALLSAGATLNRAMRVEGLVDAVATYATHLRQRVCNVLLRRPSDGAEFLLSQFPEEFVVKVDAHSTSPIYEERNIEKLMFLAEKNVLTGEDLIQLFGIPQMDRMRRKARRLAKAQADVAKERMAIDKEKADAKMIAAQS